MSSLFKVRKIKNSGFTLIELLVVIAIIGLLSTMAIVALGTARLKARDARRVADLRQIQSAFEMYNNDNGVYPPTSTINLGDSNHVCLTSGGFQVAGACAGAYLNFPKDPSGNNTYYTYSGTATNYQVSASLEGTVNGLSGPIAVSPNSGVVANSLALSIPFNTPGCYSSGAPMGTLGEQVTITRASPATYVDGNGVLQTCSAGALRVQGSPTVGVLIEPAATNYLPYSQGVFNSGNWPRGSVVTAVDSAAAAPDGAMTASSLIIASAGDNRTFSDNDSTSPIGQKTMSLWVKSATPGLRLTLWMSERNSDTMRVNQVFTLTGAWQRISITGTTTGIGSRFQIGWGTTDNGTYYVWGAQVETGSVATSYIATLGSGTVTRNADVVSVANPLSAANTNWCVAGSYQPLGAWAPAGVRVPLWSFGDGLNANSATQEGIGGTLYGAVYNPTSAWKEHDYVGVPFANGSSHRIVFCDASGPLNVLVDGTAVGADTGVGSAVLGAMQTVSLGARPAYSSFFNGVISDFRICKAGVYGQGGCQ